MRCQQYDSIYGINGSVDNTRFNTYGFEAAGRPNVNSPNVVANGNATAPNSLYSSQNGSRYGLGLPNRGNAGADSKMNGLHGPKHKRGDIDRECGFIFLSVSLHF